MRKWRIEDSEELYNITGWGTSYFGINDKGHVVVTPRRDGVTVDLKELVDELQLRDVASPMLIEIIAKFVYLINSIRTIKRELFRQRQRDFRTGFIFQSLYHITGETITLQRISTQTPTNTAFSIFPSSFRLRHHIIGNKQSQIEQKIFILLSSHQCFFGTSL